MAGERVFQDPAGRTIVYMLYVDNVRLGPEMAHLAGTEAVCRWYIDNDNHCSAPFVLSAAEASPTRYIAFVVVSMDHAESRAGGVTMTLSHADGSDHLAVAFLDEANFSRDDNLKVDVVELQSQAGVVAFADLHTASQVRWSRKGPVEPVAEAYFLDPAEDEQARTVYEFMIGELPTTATGGDVAEAAARAAEEAREAEAAAAAVAAAAAAAAVAAEEERKRAAEAEGEAEREREETRRREEARRLEEAEREREETRRREEARRLEESKLEEEAARQREERRRQQEEREAEREREELRREERERAREEARARERERMARETSWGGEAQVQGRAPCERERERLREEARLERECEVAERERRAASASPRASRREASESPRESGASPSRRSTQHEEEAAEGSPDLGHAIDLGVGQAQPQRRRSLRSDVSEDSETCAFEVAGEDDTEVRASASAPRRGACGAQPRRGAAQSHGGHSAGGGAATLGPTLAARVQRMRMRASRHSAGGPDDVESQLCLGDDSAQPSERAPPRRQGSAGRCSSSGARRRAPAAGARPARGPIAGGAPPQEAAAAAGRAEQGAALGADGAAALEDVVLRVLVLQRGLGAPRRAGLADAAAGLAPMMLRVLEAARGVCEANRCKLRTFCDERRLDPEKLGGGEYLSGQLAALEKLQAQYASLLPPEAGAEGPRRSPRPAGSPRRCSPDSGAAAPSASPPRGLVDPGGAGPALPVLRSGAPAPARAPPEADAAAARGGACGAVDLSGELAVRCSSPPQEHGQHTPWSRLAASIPPSFPSSPGSRGSPPAERRPLGAEAAAGGGRGAVARSAGHSSSPRFEPRFAAEETTPGPSAVRQPRYGAAPSSPRRRGSESARGAADGERYLRIFERLRAKGALGDDAPAATRTRRPGSSSSSEDPGWRGDGMRSGGGSRLRGVT